jgi:DNA polymerase-3 subunit gamma/tau
VNRLRAVLQNEGIEVEADALTRIARRAEGGMRDALSLLDQVLSFGSGVVRGDDVGRVLGLAGEELYLEILEIISERRHADVFRFVQRVLDEGYDLSEFYRGMADAIRALMLVKLEGAPAAEVRADLQDRYEQLALQFETADLLRMLSQVAEMDTEGRLRKATNPRLLLEALLLRFAHMDRTLEIEDLINAASGSLLGASPAPQAPVAPRLSTSPAPGPARTPASETPQADPNAQAPRPRAAAPFSGQEALQRILQTGAGVPQGLGLFLKAARVVELETGRVVLEMPPGPGLERLSAEPATRRALEALFSEQLSRAIQLEVRGIGGSSSTPDPQARLTVEGVKRDQLARLASSEPTLKKAVEEWKLELLD